MIDPLRYERAACIGHPLGQAPWFPPKTLGSVSPRRRQLDAIAKAVCATCPHLDDCREWSLPQAQLDGTWGGLTERERTLLRRQLLRDDDA